MQSEIFIYRSGMQRYFIISFEDFEAFIDAIQQLQFHIHFVKFSVTFLIMQLLKTKIKNLNYW